LLRRSVISDLVADERIAFHRAAASSLTDRPELAPELDYVAELARHWHEAEVAAPALQWLVAAGHRANESYAFEAATACYERALVWWDEVPDAIERAALDRAELLVVAARANASAGHVDRAAELGNAAMNASVDLPPTRAIDAVARLYTVMWTADRAGELFEFVANRLSTQLDEADPAVRAHYLEQQTRHALGRTDDDETRAIAARLMEAIEGVDDPDLESTVHEVMARCYEAWGENDKVDAEYERAATLAGTAENFSTLTVVRYNHACFKLAVADLPSCLRLLDDVDALVQRYGLRRFVVPASCLRVVASCLRGDLAAAEETYGLLEGQRLQGYDAWFRAYVGSLLMLFSGDYGAAVAMLQPESVGVEAVTDSDFGVEMAIVGADALAWRGDLDGARRTADAGFERLRGFYEVAAHGWLAMIAMRVEADAAATAPDATTRADELAANWGSAVTSAIGVSPLLRAYTAAIESECARAHGRESATLARAAADAFAAIDYRYDETYFRWREANAVLDAGDRRRATELLAAVRDAAGRHGFGGLEAAAATLAREHQLRLGAGRTTVDGDVPLSPRELEVLRLVVEGLTNPQIAAQLSISPHTARAHVSNVLNKLDATSRVEAVTEAQRRGLVHDALNATTSGADHS
jgi:DNA-binding CsgD family transcriptional regulator